MNNGQEQHRVALEHMLKNLHVVNEKDPFNILKEFIVTIQFPDAIIVYDEYAVPIELKHSWRRRVKAMSQLRSGKYYCNQNGIYVPYGKIVVFKEKKVQNGYILEYEHEKIAYG